MRRSSPASCNASSSLETSTSTSGRSREVTSNSFWTVDGRPLMPTVTAIEWRLSERPLTWANDSTLRNLCANSANSTVARSMSASTQLRTGLLATMLARLSMSASFAENWASRMTKASIRWSPLSSLTFSALALSSAIIGADVFGTCNSVSRVSLSRCSIAGYDCPNSSRPCRTLAATVSRASS